jgi:hypothetical protein
MMLDRRGDQAAQGVLQAAVAAALGGDVQAQALILARCWPVRRGRPVQLDLPPLVTAADLMHALSAVAAAVAAGEITPDEGQAVGAVLDLHRRAIETSDLEQRLVALEREQENR